MSSEHHRSDILFTIGVLLLLWAAWEIRSVLLLIYVSALFAVVVGPGIELVRRIRIGRWRPGRGLAIVVIIVGGLAALTIFFVFALPPIFRDAEALARDWPRKAGAIAERLRGLPFADRLNPAALQEYAARAVGGIFGIFKGIAGGLFGFFSWLILTVYFIVDGERAFYFIMSLFSPAQRPRVEATMLRAEDRIRHWLLGQATLMLILGLSSGVLFGLLHIKYFYALAFFAGLANIVPIVGPVASVVLAGIVAAFDSWGKLAGVLIFYFVYQQVENAFLTPRIMKTTVNLPALAVIIALAMGGALAGVLGALVAVPTAAVVAVFVDEYLVQSSPNPATQEGRQRSQETRA
jgi:predicted PurR-regulated permease PerM